MLSPKEIAYAVTKALDEKKGMNIKLLKIDTVSSLADYFLNVIGLNLADKTCIILHSSC